MNGYQYEILLGTAIALGRGRLQALKFWDFTHLVIF